MENSNGKKSLQEIERMRELMYGKDLLNEQLTTAVKNAIKNILRTTISDIIRAGVSKVDDLIRSVKESFGKIITKVEKSLGRNLTQGEKMAAYNELKATADDMAKSELKKVTDAGGPRYVGPEPKVKPKVEVKPKAGPATSPDKKLITKGNNITDKSGNVIVKNGKVTDLTPALIKSETGIIKVAPGISDDLMKANFKSMCGAFDEPGVAALTGMKKSGKGVVGKLTDFSKKAMINLGILKKVNGKLRISWKRVLLYAAILGVGGMVVAAWFRDNDVVPEKDPNEPVINTDQSIIPSGTSNGNSSGSDGSNSGSDGFSNSGTPNRYTFDFVEVMKALDATGKCPTGYSKEPDKKGTSSEINPGLDVGSEDLRLTDKEFIELTAD